MKYEIILIDPPWFYNDKMKGLGLSSCSHYETLTKQRISNLPIQQIAKDDCCLFLWVTSPLLDEGIEVLKNWGFCVSRGTKILKDNLEYVDAEKLKIGDNLLAFDENRNEKGRRNYKFTKVLNTGIEKLPCYEVTLSTGQKIVCTGDHKWLCRLISPNGVPFKWIKTIDLMDTYNGRRKYPIGLLKIAPSPSSEHITNYKSDYLAAAFDGEGSLHEKRPRLTFAQNENSMLSTVEKYLKFFEIDYSRYPYDNKKTVQLGINGGFISTLDFLMQFRSPRLLDKWTNYDFKSSLYNIRESTEVKSVKYVGNRDVVALSTDSRTYIAEGFASHNTYKTIAFCWSKITKKGKSVSNLGRWTMGNIELCLLGIKGKPNPWREDKSIKQLVRAIRTKHSKKPNEVRRRIVQLFGNRSRIELFATQKYDGWTAIGYEIDGLDIKDSLEKIIKE